MQDNAGSNHIQLLSLVTKATHILFDLDGTLINSEHFHQKAFSDVVYENTHEKDVFKLWHEYFGKSDSEIYQIIKNKNIGFDLSLKSFLETKEQKLYEILIKEELTNYLTPGIERFLDYLKEKNKVLFVVSASEQSFVDTIVNNTILKNYLKDFFGTKHTFLSKPSCSPYLNVLRKEKILSTQAIIFEDSDNGLKSARESNCKTVRVLENIDIANTPLNERACYEIKNFNDLNLPT